MSWIMPFPEKAITGEYGTMSEFRRKRGMQPHSGTDWSPAGSNKGKTPIPAVAKGTIKLVQFSKVLGWVVVQTAMDKDRKVWYIGYCHVKCDKHGVNCKGGHDASEAIKLKVGDKVQAGDTVAIMGNTGIASSGVHLHATASRRIKGVFGVTADKADLKKLIKENQGNAPKAAPSSPAKPAVKPQASAPKVQAPAPTPTKSAAPAFHKVASGDSLSGIAAKYGTTVPALIRLNGIRDANKIFVGQMIRLGK